MNEKSWERTDKGGSSTESFDLRGRVSLLFLCSFLCRRVIAYLLSSSSKKKSTTTLHGGKSIFWERIPTFHFLKRILVPVGEFVSIKIESSLLFFFLGDCVSYRFLEKSTLSETLSWRVDTFFPDKQKPTLLETLGLGELVIKFVNDAPAIRFGFRRGCWSPN